MKYPVLKIRSLPSLFKHCSNVYTLHIDFKDEGIHEDEQFVRAYLDYVKQQIYTSITANFITALASIVNSQNDDFIIFKSNIAKNMLFDFMYAQFAELDAYCNQKIVISFRYVEVILSMENKEVSVFKMNKVGEDLQESMAYKNATTLYKHDKKPRGKQFASMEEYCTIYERLLKLPTKKHVPVEVQNEKVIHSTEDSCEYYI